METEDGDTLTNWNGAYIYTLGCASLHSPSLSTLDAPFPSTPKSKVSMPLRADGKEQNGNIWMSAGFFFTFSSFFQHGGKLLKENKTKTEKKDYPDVFSLRDRQGEKIEGK